MKKYFLTGLAILLPIVLTLVIVNFALNIMTKPFVGVIESFLSKKTVLQSHVGTFTAAQIILWTSKFLVLVFLFLFVMLTGIIGRFYFGSHLIRWTNAILHRVPLVNTVYKSAQDVVQTIFREQGHSFSKTVIIPFPHPNCYSIGFLISEIHSTGTPATKNEKVSVYVPGTPNPMMGFMILYPKDKIIQTPMTVEEGIKYIVSCGVMVPKSLSNRT